MAETNTHADDQPAVGHLVPVRVLLGTAIALLILTWITVAVYWVDLGHLNLWIAVGIATIKATLVALFFMHLRYDRPFNSIAVVGAVLFVLLFIGFTLTDAIVYKPYVDEPDSPLYAPSIERE